MGKILVTGGAGYIGAHTVKRLVQAGHDVVVLDNLSTGHRDFARFCDFMQGDVRDPVLLDSLFSSRAISAVIHFAAASQVGESVRDPLFYYQNNVSGALALLCAMRKHMVSTLVFSSTCAVYGPPFDGLLTEDHAIAPLSPYAATKFMIERIMEDMARTQGLKYVALRYFNAAGADTEAEVGERHLPETHLIPLVLQTALGQRDHLDIMAVAAPAGGGVKSSVSAVPSVPTTMQREARGTSSESSKSPTKRQPSAHSKPTLTCPPGSTNCGPRTLGAGSAVSSALTHTGRALNSQPA